LDDYLTDHTVEDLWRLVRPIAPVVRPRPAAPVQLELPLVYRAGQPVALDQALAVFGKWLHLGVTPPTNPHLPDQCSTLPPSVPSGRNQLPSATSRSAATAAFAVLCGGPHCCDHP
jgi:hypothetical protein